MHLNHIGGSVLLASLICGSLAQPAAAQYFGRQKVQYDHFDWNVMRTPHFSVYFYPQEEVAARDAARMAERWYVRHSGSFQHEFKDKPLIFYADAPDFQQTNVISDMLGEGVGGVTEPIRNRVIMPFTGVYADNDHVLGHELVHVFQYDLATAGPGSGGLAGMSRLPLWLVEGMAEYLSLGRNDPLTAMWMRDAALRGELPTIEQLTRDTRYFPYRYGQALLAYVGGRWGDRAVVELFVAAARGGVEDAMHRVLGVTPQQLSQDWITSVRATYLPMIAGRQRARDAGTPIIVDTEPGAMNLGPAVSPDGRYVAYFGRRSLFAIDLLLADARTGRFIRKLSSPTTDQHYDALSFIQSVGTWSPDSRQFAFVVYEKGDQRIDVLDVASARVVKTLRPAGVEAIEHLAWSPDGRLIAFSGTHGGLSDLYVIDVATAQVRQLTHDRYADLEPAWSPDGATLAFVSDRATGTDLDRLAFGPAGLELMDVATGAIRPVQPFAGVRVTPPEWPAADQPSPTVPPRLATIAPRSNTRPAASGTRVIDPHFSADGRSLYFRSDRDGFSDIYRYELATGAVYRVTRLATGVSGITAISPAFSVSAGDGRLLFSAFENSGYNIYGIDAGRAGGEPVAPAPAIEAEAGVLPPLEAQGGGLVEAYLADPDRGLPASGGYPTAPYRSRLGLDYLGPPSVGIGVSNYGTLIGGSASAWFGDMLGDHMLGLGIQASGTVKDIGGQAVYQNLAHRVNWGVGAAHIPYLTGFATVSDTTLGDGSPALLIDQYLDRIYVDQAQVFAQLPLSTTRRFEVSGGYTRYGFGREIDRSLVDAIGNTLAVDRLSAPSPAPLHFFENSLAFVTDHSYFGFTSPVLGSRSRYQVSPTLGSLQLFSILGDYRRYAMAGQISFAARALHYGRYGRDADGINSAGETVLSPLFVGSPYLIRGYSSGSFNASECRPTPGASDCPAFDRLLGSRLAVVNLEVRLPLIGNDQFGLLRGVPFLPTEIAPFLDAGLAWSKGDDVKLELARNTRSRVPVFSTGISARFNILGYLVLETYWAYPFQRPDKGGHFGIQINPGW